jgi:hydroxymethylpyrimidine pyrophosphatase-like HAD family hydrolase
VKVVLISGARHSTIMQRLHFLPAADAIVVEGGGRIFFPGALPTVAPLQEDLRWRAVHAATAGPAGQDAVPPAQRVGSLWQLFAALQRGELPGLQGVKLDAASYTTAFRLKLPGGAAQVAALEAALPAGLATAANMGGSDVFPATSGKENAAAHILARFGSSLSQSVFMCGE